LYIPMNSTTAFSGPGDLGGRLPGDRKKRAGGQNKEKLKEKTGRLPHRPLMLGRGKKVHAEGKIRRHTSDFLQTAMTRPKREKKEKGENRASPKSGSTRWKRELAIAVANSALPQGRNRTVQMQKSGR